MGKPKRERALPDNQAMAMARLLRTARASSTWSRS